MTDKYEEDTAQADEPHEEAVVRPEESGSVEAETITDLPRREDIVVPLGREGSSEDVKDRLIAELAGALDNASEGEKGATSAYMIDDVAGKLLVLADQDGSDSEDATQSHIRLAPDDVEAAALLLSGALQEDGDDNRAQLLETIDRMTQQLIEAEAKAEQNGVAISPEDIRLAEEKILLLHDIVQAMPEMPAADYGDYHSPEGTAKPALLAETAAEVRASMDAQRVHLYEGADMYARYDDRELDNARGNLAEALSSELAAAPLEGAEQDEAEVMARGREQAISMILRELALVYEEQISRDEVRAQAAPPNEAQGIYLSDEELGQVIVKLPAGPQNLSVFEGMRNHFNREAEIYASADVVDERIARTKSGIMQQIVQQIAARQRTN